MSTPETDADLQRLKSALYNQQCCMDGLIASCLSHRQALLKGDPGAIFGEIASIESVMRACNAAIPETNLAWRSVAAQWVGSSDAPLNALSLKCLPEPWYTSTASLWGRILNRTQTARDLIHEQARLIRRPLTVTRECLDMLDSPTPDHQAPYGQPNTGVVSTSNPAWLDEKG